MTDIRKFMNLVELGDVDPSRPVDRDEHGRVLHPDVTYDVNDSKVVATLRSYKSQSYTKLAQKIEEVEALEARATELKEEIKQEGRNAIAELFSADDAIRTRVIETVSFIMKLTKDPAAATTVKYEKVITELTVQLTPELTTVLKALIEKYSTVQKAKPAALSYEMKPKSESVDLSEGMLDKIKALATKFMKAVTTWGSKYDAKLRNLEAMVGVQEAIGSLETPVVETTNPTIEEGFFKATMMSCLKIEEAASESQTETFEESLMNELNTSLKGVGVSDRLTAKKIADKVQGDPHMNMDQVKQLVARYAPALGKNESDYDYISSLVVSELENRKAEVSEAPMATTPYDQYNHVGKDFLPKAPQPNDARKKNAIDRAADVHPDMGTTESEMVSKWKTPKGNFVYVWRVKPRSNDGKAIDGKGKVIALHGSPQTISDIEKTLSDLYHCTKDGGNMELSLADAEDMAPEAGEEGLTEYQAQHEDMFPVVTTLDDAELLHYAQWIDGLKHAVDSSTEMGNAFFKFADDVKAECTARNIC